MLRTGYESYCHYQRYHQFLGAAIYSRSGGSSGKQIEKAIARAEDEKGVYDMQDETDCMKTAGATLEYDEVSDQREIGKPVQSGRVQELKLLQ